MKLEKLGDLALSGEEMPRTMIDRMRDLEKRQAALRDEVADLQRRQEHSESSYIVRRVEELVAVLRRKEAAAKELNAALRAVFARIVVDYELGALECRWGHMPEGRPLILELPPVEARG